MSGKNVWKTLEKDISNNIWSVQYTNGGWNMQELETGQGKICKKLNIPWRPSGLSRHLYWRVEWDAPISRQHKAYFFIFQTECLNCGIRSFWIDNHNKYFDWDQVLYILTTWSFFDSSIRQCFIIRFVAHLYNNGDAKSTRS